MSLDDDFKSAQDRVKTLPSRPSNDVLLQLYGLYKQGTEGDARGKRPGLLDPKGRAKYDAWASLSGTPNEEAKERYVALVDRLLNEA